MQNNLILRLKYSLLELEKSFMGLKDIESKDRKEKIKKEIVKLFNKPIIAFKRGMVKFEEQGRKL